MLQLNFCGRLIKDAEIITPTDPEKSKFLALTVSTNTLGGESVIVSCTRTIKDTPRNMESLKKGASISFSGELDWEIYQTKGENPQPAVGIKCKVNAMQVQSTVPGAVPKSNESIAPGND